jgi:hypothetical protein
VDHETIPDPENSAAMRHALDVLAERIAVIIEFERATDDVADHQRGHYFPPHLITRDARKGAPQSYKDVIPVAELPERLIQLAQSAELIDIDLGILLTAMSVNLQQRFEHFFIVLNNEVDTRGPNVSTAIRLAGYDPDSAEARSRLRPDRPLRALGLIEITNSNRSLLTQVLTVPERVVAHLLGDDEFAPGTSSIASFMGEPLLPDELLPILPVDVELPVIFRAGSGTAGREQAYAIAYQKTGKSPLLIDGLGLSKNEDSCSLQIRECVREAALAGAPIILDIRHADTGMSVSEIARLFRTLSVAFVILIEAKAHVELWHGQTVDLPLPTAAMRRDWWSHLGDDKDRTAAADAAIHVDPQELHAHLVSGGPLVPRAIETGTLTEAVEPEFTLEDLVASARVTDSLRELRDRVRHRTVVLDEWRMRPGGGRGRGVTALFSGPSGTGKTMAAEALAGELGVPLFRVNLASVVDKYIGETEKKLDRVFASVEDVDGVLLFDEADALFSKRSGVSDSRDRYANLEVAYLLQRMESFDGLAVLTTNLRANLDEALIRRLDAAIDFPEPEAEERYLLWLACLKGNMGRVGQNHLQRLSMLPLTGGSIRAASVSAAYFAAAQGELLGPTHLFRGMQQEWSKQGRLSFPMTEFEESFAEATHDELD